MKIFFRGAPLLHLIRGGKRKGHEATWNNWMRPWDRLVGPPGKHQNHRMLEPGWTASLCSPSSFFWRNKIVARRSWLIRHLGYSDFQATECSVYLLLNQKWDNFLHKDYAHCTNLSSTGGCRENCEVLVHSECSVISTRGIHGRQLLQSKSKLHPQVDIEWDGPGCPGQATDTTVYLWIQ